MIIRYIELMYQKAHNSAVFKCSLLQKRIDVGLHHIIHTGNLGTVTVMGLKLLVSSLGRTVNQWTAMSPDSKKDTASVLYSVLMFSKYFLVTFLLQSKNVQVKSTGQLKPAVDRKLHCICCVFRLLLNTALQENTSVLAAT